MIRILHTADWHIDAPLREFNSIQRRALRDAMLTLPGQIVDLAIREGCDIMLIAGDVFDGTWTREGYEAVYRALERVGIPVFIAPGNHDPYRELSIWTSEPWPENVYLFRSPEVSSYRIAELDCRIYGAAFTSDRSGALLEGFLADCEERHAMMVLHGDPTSVSSPYNAITSLQVREAGLEYVALGHIHATGSFTAGAGVCAWPGCPMGHGFDETGVKGVLIAEVSDSVELRFVPLSVPKFYSHTVEAGADPQDAVASLLPPGGSRDHFRIRVTGEADPERMDHLRSRFPDHPNLTLLDDTVQSVDVWESAGEDNLAGLFFKLLQDQALEADPKTAEALELAARIGRRILDGREVKLP